MAQNKLIEHKHYINKHGQDLPEIRNWKGATSNECARTLNSHIRERARHGRLGSGRRVLAMATIEFEADTFNIDATLLGESLGIEPSFVQARMHEGKITSFCERGVGGDAGRYRLTFFYENRRVRFIIDEGGIIILRSMIDFGDRQLPASMRKPGA